MIRRIQVSRRPPKITNTFSLDGGAGATLESSDLHGREKKTQQNLMVVRNSGDLYEHMTDASRAKRDRTNYFWPKMNMVAARYSP